MISRNFFGLNVTKILSKFFSRKKSSNLNHVFDLWYISSQTLGWVRILLEVNAEGLRTDFHRKQYQNLFRFCILILVNTGFTHCGFVYVSGQKQREWKSVTYAKIKSVAIVAFLWKKWSESIYSVKGTLFHSRIGTIWHFITQPLKAKPRPLWIAH